MNSNLKSRMRDNIIVQMQQYLDTEILQVLDSVLIDLFENVDMEERKTLPVEVQNSIDEKNKYIIQLFIYKKSNLSKKTLGAYLEAIKMLLTYTDKELAAVNDIDIAGFLKWYEYRNKHTTGKRNRETTVNNQRKFLSAFFGWMSKEKLIKDNPVETIPPLPEPKRPIDFFTRTEIAELREGCRDERDRALLETLRSTGARVGELQRIDRFKINWDTGDVYIIGEKGGRYRVLYLDEDCRYYLKKYLVLREDDMPELFISRKYPYSPLQKEAVENILRNIGKRAGLTCRVYPHKFRKTLGMDLRNKGVDIGVIQEVLGHSSPEVTAKYYAESTTETLRGIRKRTA